MKKAYTKDGDAGRTRDRAGRRLAKDDVRIVAGGKIDALQSAIDLALLTAKGRMKAVLQEVQEKLWEEASRRDVERLESFIDSLGEPPKQFVRFKALRAIRHNECRIRCRELESACTPLLRSGKMSPAAYAWLNRLSSLFFMLAVRESRRRPTS